MRTERAASLNLLSLALLFAGPAAFGQQTDRWHRPPAHDWHATVAELERLIPALMDSGAVTGLSIAMVADGELVWSRGYGARNAETGEPVDKNTVFEAASLSKPVFAYAVLQLVDRGELDLDKPLAEYLEYEDIADDERYRRITARMVLSHTPGFPNWRPRDGRLTINFDPGSKFSYSGEGFVYLQRVVEHLTGEPMHQYMKRTVLEPLGMTTSSYVWEDRFAENVAVGHTTGGEARDKFKPSEGNVAWSLQTTAPDFARFLKAVLNGDGLSERIAHEMLTPQIEVESGVSWGLGVGLEDSDAGRNFWHWGHNSGYRAYTLSYPDKGYGLVWLINSNNGMLILEALLSVAAEGSHPVVAWLDYEPYDSPKRRVQLALEETIKNHGIEAGLGQYHELKKERPAEAFEESMLNTLGYSLLRGDLVEDAIAILKLNVEMFPDAFNTYDSLGEGYMVHGDLELAIENYERSVELNPDNTNGIRMLENLRKELAAKKKGAG